MFRESYDRESIEPHRPPVKQRSNSKLRLKARAEKHRQVERNRRAKIARSRAAILDLMTEKFDFLNDYHISKAKIYDLAAIIILASSIQDAADEIKLLLDAPKVQKEKTPAFFSKAERHNESAKRCRVTISDGIQYIRGILAISSDVSTFELNKLVERALLNCFTSFTESENFSDASPSPSQIVN